jgi:hypothetical protein
MARGGANEENALAVSGLQHLISLTPKEPPWKEFPIEGARPDFSANGTFARGRRLMFECVQKLTGVNIIANSTTA